MSNSVLGVKVLVFLLLVAGFCSVAHAGSIDSPIAHWTFDEASGTTAYDSAGSNNGTLVNGPARNSGIIGGALNFDGANDYINVPYNSAFQLPVFTVSAWINPDVDPTTKSGTILARGEDASSDNWALVLRVDKLGSATEGVSIAYEGSSDQDYYWGTGYYPSMNTWTHIAASRTSDGLLSVYINGNLYRQWSSTLVPTNRCFQNFTVGATWFKDSGSPYVTGFFDGGIDDVRVYDYALSGQEVALLVPEPLTMALLGLGGLMMRKRK